MKSSRFAVGMMILSAMIVAPISQALAAGSESISRIGRSRAEKQLVISYLQSRISRHQSMTTEQIVADLAATAEHNRQLLNSKDPSVAANAEKEIVRGLDGLKALGDKDLIIAMETAQLQKIVSSENYMLYIMNYVAPQMAYLVCSCGDPVISGILGGFFVLPLDLVAIPVEFIITAATGF